MKLNKKHVLFISLFIVLCAFLIGIRTLTKTQNAPQVYNNSSQEIQFNYPENMSVYEERITSFRECFDCMGDLTIHTQQIHEMSLDDAYQYFGGSNLSQKIKGEIMIDGERALEIIPIDDGSEITYARIYYIKHNDTLFQIYDRLHRTDNSRADFLNSISFAN